ncbi:MAG: hypothetical protein IPK17_19795 [Chloroflexi bacterium]|uniref:hypothetical protein n=1 Tax=Candidatus Flexifilum breve TaxID=3140694 RepID=UPI003135803E|nr:hypothetical protein [Chloroflexota bacterium]
MWLSIGGEGDAMPVPNSVVLACQQKTCDYPHAKAMQGTVLGSPLTYYEANLNAESIRRSCLRPDQTWWIVDARRATVLHLVFTTRGAPLVCNDWSHRPELRRCVARASAARCRHPSGVSQTAFQLDNLQGFNSRGDHHDRLLFHESGCVTS